MLRETGTCLGIENYAAHLGNRASGDTPRTLLDYVPDDSLPIVDESHVALPQVRCMARGDRARKETLVRYGFRLPSALENRPQTFEELERHRSSVIVSLLRQTSRPPVPGSCHSTSTHVPTCRGIDAASAAKPG